MFTRSDEGFRFARWGRDLAPAVFGTDATGEGVVAEALGAVGALGGLRVVGADPELGRNFLVFFCTEWPELTRYPGIDRLIPDIAKLVSVLQGAGANQYRIFGFAPDGAIRLCITLLRYDADLRSVPAQALAVSQAVMGLLLWSDAAFTEESPTAVVTGGRTVVKPWHADLIRAAYDPTLPAAAEDGAFALRLAARMQTLRAG